MACGAHVSPVGPKANAMVSAKGQLAGQGPMGTSVVPMSGSAHQRLGVNSQTVGSETCLKAWFDKFPRRQPRMEQKQFKGSRPTDLFMFILSMVGGLGTVLEELSLLPSLFLFPSSVFFI